jgi:hypothetical protein
MQPSRRARCTGYLTSPSARSRARLSKVPAKRRREIASMGGHAKHQQAA